MRGSLQKTVEIFLRGKRVASHLRSVLPHRPTTVAEHMPSSHRSYRATGHMSAFAARPPKARARRRYSDRRSSCVRGRIPNKASARPSGFSGS